jgi:outer membrane protein TolC
MELRLARDLVHTKGETVEGMEDHVKASKEEVSRAEADIETAEADMLAAPEASDEDLAADAAHAKGMKRLARAEGDLEKVQGTLKLARAEMDKAYASLRLARANLEAIRQGRRKR